MKKQVKSTLKNLEIKPLPTDHTNKIKGGGKGQANQAPGAPCDDKHPSN